MVGTWWSTKTTTARRVLTVGSVAALVVALTLVGAGSADAAPPGGAKPGKLAALVLSPATATIAPGGSRAYTAQGFDAAGNSLGDVTSRATFTISAGGSCTANTCTATAAGAHTVTGAIKKVSGTATLTVAVTDLAAGQTVSDASPFSYAPMTFTTTITNTSTTSTAAGVNAAVNVPAGLNSPAVTTSTGSYDASTSTWTIGSLAPGASATLTITADAAAVSDGAQTVTATVSAATFDPNPANNTASASATSRPPPVQAIITLDPASPNPIDVCVEPGDPVTTTLYGSAVNAANPSAPPSSIGDVFFEWNCSTNTPFCPTAVFGPANSSITFTNNAEFMLLQQYTVNLAVYRDPMRRVPLSSAEVVLTTRCIF